MPNTEFINSLIEFMREQGEDHFCMRWWFSQDGIPVPVLDTHSPGTTACIAGHAIMLARQRGLGVDLRRGVGRVAMDLLGVEDGGIGLWLFYGMWRDGTEGEVTLSEAIRALGRVRDGAATSDGGEVMIDMKPGWGKPSLL